MKFLLKNIYSNVYKFNNVSFMRDYTYKLKLNLFIGKKIANKSRIQYN